MKQFPVTSNSLRNIAYDPETQQMEVEFHSGHRYRLHQVAPGQYYRFINADSRGDFYNQEFRPFPNDHQIQRLDQSKESRAADEEPTSD